MDATEIDIEYQRRLVEFIMLRNIQNSYSSGAKSYNGGSDYYTKDQELPGVWRGKSASQLGLVGQIQQADWESLCDNRNPTTS